MPKDVAAGRPEVVASDIKVGRLEEVSPKKSCQPEVVVPKEEARRPEQVASEVEVIQPRSHRR